MVSKDKFKKNYVSEMVLSEKAVNPFFIRGGLSIENDECYLHRSAGSCHLAISRAAIYSEK